MHSWFDSDTVHRVKGTYTVDDTVQAAPALWPPVSAIALLAGAQHEQPLVANGSWVGPDSIMTISLKLAEDAGTHPTPGIYPLGVSFKR